VSEPSGQPDDSDLTTADPEIDEIDERALGFAGPAWVDLAAAALLLGVPAGLIYLATVDSPSGWIKWPVLAAAGWIGLVLLLAVGFGLQAGRQWLRDRRRQ
jgi:hypothetical protein